VEKRVEHLGQASDLSMSMGISTDVALTFLKDNKWDLDRTIQDIQRNQEALLTIHNEWLVQNKTCFLCMEAGDSWAKHVCPINKCLANKELCIECALEVLRRDGNCPLCRSKLAYTDELMAALLCE
jgi:hypothetical protein